jgi:lipoyl(octanoyl) transferase
MTVLYTRGTILPHFITLPGLTDYQNGIKIMEEKLFKIINGQENDTVFLLEHQPVYTAGTSANEAELLNKDLFPVIHAGRGGKFTYHGPGQRVIYPVINLNHNKDLKLYIRNLEEWIIQTLASFGVKAYIIPGKVGIWVKNKANVDAKVGAIGVRVKKWVAYHGIAININPNLAHYSGIIPCGIGDLPVTSLEEMGVNVTMAEFDLALKNTQPSFEDMTERHCEPSKKAWQSQEPESNGRRPS